MGPDYLTVLILTYRYWIVIPLTFVEGPMVALVVGTLSSFGYFNPFIAILIFFVKDMVMDAGFYFLGRYAKKAAFVQRLLKKGGLVGESTDKLRMQWQDHAWRTMFISKLPHGFASAFLTMSGVVEAPLGKFLMYGAIIALIQYGLLFTLGYFFGSFIGAHAGAVSWLQYIVTGIFIAVGVYFVLVWYLRRRLREKGLE